MKNIFKNWLAPARYLLPFSILFLLLQFLIRVTLWLRTAYYSDFTGEEVAQIFLKGMWFDLVTLSCVLIPVAIVCLFPLNKKADYVFRFLFLYVLLFGAVAEHLFWSEFYTRFNFIAVDYLVYTNEVIGNITESYPIPLLLTLIGLCALFLTWLSTKIWPHQAQQSSFATRGLRFALIIVCATILISISNADQAGVNQNAEATELALNGTYSLFHAFRHNEINYESFYVVRDPEKVKKDIQRVLFEEGKPFVKADGSGIVRRINSPLPENHMNVIFVVMESMSAVFMDTFGGGQNVTPNLDRLAKEGLFFSNAYATGTRTVRGLEAVTLSLPPTPGQSILRRPGNEDLFSVGKIFKDRGYDTKFIYGGYGYFDNMNAFFSGNHFDIVDRTMIPDNEITFANIWGICDEDLFARVIKEADQSAAQNKPFMHVVMTTSNHRPYTFPDGRIDIKSKTGRLGGIKYADFAIGKLLQDAEKKPWFKNTVFVFVSDHTAGASGKVELDPIKYHIPIIFYAPGFIKPQVYDKLTSQINVAPVVLGLLHFSYDTKFFGEDVMRDPDETPHTFISNYQKVALVREGQMTILEPQRKVENVSWPGGDELPPAQANKDIIDDAVTYYQTASWWRKNFQSIPTVISKGQE